MSTQPGGASSRLLRAWLLTGVIDGSWAIVLTALYGRSQARLWQGIAATLFGERMFAAGVPAIALGVAMHFGVAFAWSAVFLRLVLKSPWLRGVLASPGGVFGVAAVYGPFVWIVMSAVVIPALTQKPLVITWRWWIQLAGHVVFVGLPIVWAIARAPRSAMSDPLVAPSRA